MNGLQLNNFLIKRWSGPVNYYHLQSTIEGIPSFLLFGDEHSGFDGVCDNKRDMDMYTISPSSGMFVQLLANLGSVDQPVDYFVENWFHFKDPDKEVYRIKSPLSEVVHLAIQSQKQSLMHLTKNTSIQFNETCGLCRKPILLNQYYSYVENLGYYHARCTHSVRWHSIDVRQPSHMYNVIESQFNLTYLSNLTNIDWYLLGGLLNVEDEFYSKKIDYKKRYRKLGKPVRKLNTLQFAKNLFNILQKDPIYMENSKSILIKELNQLNEFKDIDWIGLYKKSIDKYLSFYEEIDEDTIRSFSKWIKNVSNGDERGGRFVYESIALCCTSPMVDLYTIARLLKVVFKNKSKLCVLYAGGNHVVNIVSLLTNDIPLYFEIDKVEMDRKGDVNRCLEIQNYNQL